MEENSGVTFLEAQAALAKQWLGQPYPDAKDPHKVFIQEPSTSGEAIVVTEKSEKNGKEIEMPATEEEARHIIERFQSGAEGVRGDEEVADTVSQHMLSDRTSLLEEKWLGSEQEEKDS